MRTLLAFLSLLMFWQTTLAQQTFVPLWGYSPDSLPKLPTDKDFTHFEFVHKLNGFSGFNYLDKDFSQLSHDFLIKQNFDTQTIWPLVKNTPSFFSPAKWMENSKNPGLNIKQLHKLNITGEGITVAVIDKPINPDHIEFTGRIRYIEAISDPAHSRLHFHGMACASILAGNSCGILPKAQLFYFAVPDNGKNSNNYLIALEKLFEINDTLPASKKIRAVSISDQFDTRIPEIAEKLPVILQKAREREIAIINVASIKNIFLWGGCPPDKDPNKVENYELADPRFTSTGYDIGKIMIPANFRTTASNENNRSYTYWGTAGASWAIPYLAGVMALGWSINPVLTENELYDILIRTKTETSNKWFCINPKGFIDEIKSKKGIK